MARHNEVTLYGRVIQDPKLLYSSTDESNPSRTLLRVIGAIAVVRGIRDFGAIDKRIRIDVPIILSQNKKIMKQMKTWEVGDMILIRGTLATVNVTKSHCCPHCQQIEQMKTTLAFINPIFMKTECKGLSPEEGNRDMRQNAEISNRITVIGKACTAPELFVTDKGQRITNYQLDIMRKYRIKEDDEENKHDFPFVKSYGFVADNDYRAIQEGGMVFVDGAIQTREFTKTHACPFCQTEYVYRDSATEIVPYSTEYLTGCKTMEEIEEERRQEEIAAGQAARAQLFGDDTPFDSEDIDNTVTEEM